MCGGGESHEVGGGLASERGAERWPVHYMQNRVHHSAPESRVKWRRVRRESKEEDGGRR